MQLFGRIHFWGNDVGCFCHEALGRALHDAFGDVRIVDFDLAHRKYSNVASHTKLERSAWREFLRNGPAYTFELPFGVSGRLSRYSISFDIPDGVDGAEVDKIRGFLASLQLGKVEIEEVDLEK